MGNTTLHIRIKKDYAAALIEDLIKVHAAETVDDDEAIELTPQQKEALDKELSAIASNPDYLQKWDDIKLIRNHWDRLNKEYLKLGHTVSLRYTL